MIETDKYRIRKSDSLNWTIEEQKTIQSGKRKGETDWIAKGFFPRLDMAARAALHLEIARADTDDLQELILAVRGAETRITLAIKEIK